MRLLLCPMLVSCIFYCLTRTLCLCLSLCDRFVSCLSTNGHRKWRISINHHVSSRFFRSTLKWTASAQGPIGLDGPKGEPVSERMMNGKDEQLFERKEK